MVKKCLDSISKLNGRAVIISSIGVIEAEIFIDCLDCFESDRKNGNVYIILENESTKEEFKIDEDYIEGLEDIDEPIIHLSNDIDIQICTA